MKPIFIYIEEHEGQLFAYCSRDSSFMGQGVTAEALLRRLMDDVQDGTAFVIDKERGGQMLIERGLTEARDGATISIQEVKGDGA